MRGTHDGSLIRSFVKKADKRLSRVKQGKEYASFKNASIVKLVAHQERRARMMGGTDVKENRRALHEPIVVPLDAKASPERSVVAHSRMVEEIPLLTFCGRKTRISFRPTADRSDADSQSASDRSKLAPLLREALDQLQEETQDQIERIKGFSTAFEKSKQSMETLMRETVSAREIRRNDLYRAKRATFEHSSNGFIDHSVRDMRHAASMQQLKMDRKALQCLLQLSEESIDWSMCSIAVKKFFRVVKIVVESKMVFSIQLLLQLLLKSQRRVAEDGEVSFGDPCVRYLVLRCAGLLGESVDTIQEFLLAHDTPKLEIVDIAEAAKIAERFAIDLRKSNIGDTHRISQRITFAKRRASGFSKRLHLATL